MKKTKEPVNRKAVQDFHEKVGVWSNLFPDKKPIPAFFSVGGFTQDALAWCHKQGIGTAEQIDYYFL